jgi:hypothetical protein
VSAVVPPACTTLCRGKAFSFSLRGQRSRGTRRQCSGASSARSLTLTLSPLSVCTPASASVSDSALNRAFAHRLQVESHRLRDSLPHKALVAVSGLVICMLSLCLLLWFPQLAPLYVAFSLSAYTPAFACVSDCARPCACRLQVESHRLRDSLPRKALVVVPVFVLCVLSPCLLWSPPRVLLYVAFSFSLRGQRDRGTRRQCSGALSARSLTLTLSPLSACTPASACVSDSALNRAFAHRLQVESHRLRDSLPHKALVAVSGLVICMLSLCLLLWFPQLAPLYVAFSLSAYTPAFACVSDCARPCACRLQVESHRLRDSLPRKALASGLPRQCSFFCVFTLFLHVCLTQSVLLFPPRFSQSSFLCVCVCVCICVSFLCVCVCICVCVCLVRSVCLRGD